MFSSLSYSNNNINTDKDSLKLKKDSLLIDLLMMDEHHGKPTISYLNELLEEYPVDSIIGLDKKVYYPCLNLTFEYRSNYINCHDNSTFILCYNENHCEAIPFYFQHDKNTINLNLFEKKINNAIKYFYNYSSYKGIHDFEFYQQVFFQCVIYNLANYPNLANYRIHQIYEKDYDYVIFQVQKMIDKGKTWRTNTDCYKNAMKNIELLFAEEKNAVNVEMYNLPDNQCQLKVIYFKDSIDIKIINGNCFFEIIF